MTSNTTTYVVKGDFTEKMFTSYEEARKYCELLLEGGHDVDFELADDKHFSGFSTIETLGNGFDTYTICTL